VGRAFLKDPSSSTSASLPAAATDLVSRFLGQKLAERLKQPVVVEQKVGGTGLIANDAVAKAPPDGHTMVLLTGGHPGTAAVMKKLPYDRSGTSAW